MKTLEVDAGNSRIKWRVIDGAGLQKKEITRGTVLAYNTKNNEAAMPSSFQIELQELTKYELQAIRVSNVRGKLFADGLSVLCEEFFSLPVEYAVVKKNHRGLENSYQEPSALGVDRWLAMLAVYKLGSLPACIVDFGSAITIDFIDGAGRHEGGFIVPGMHTIKRSLSENTSDLPFLQDDLSNVLPAKKTSDAINHGALNMVIGMLERVKREWGEDKEWFLCGGDAEFLSSFITWPHELKVDLVLDGLEISFMEDKEGS